MRVSELAEVPDEELPLQAMKDHLRLGSGFADDGLQDGLVRSYLRAALAAIEGRIGKILIARDFQLLLTGWHEMDAQVLPLAPVMSVAAVNLIGGTEPVALAPERWALEADLHRPRLVARGGAFPVLPPGGQVEVVLSAGFGPWAAVPADLRQAVLLLAAQFHEFRHEPQDGAGALPFGVMALIERWRTVRLIGGRR